MTPSGNMRKGKGTQPGAADSRHLTPAWRRDQAWVRGKRERTAADPERLLHELDVHRIELELQNEELGRARAEAEAGLVRYLELYDSAPVGYFTLDRIGTIREMNLRGAQLLGQERARLVGMNFNLFVLDDDRPAFNALLDEVFESGGRGSCDLALGGEEEPRWVHVDAAASEDRRECQVVLADITERVRAEERARSLALLSDQNPSPVLRIGKDGTILYANVASAGLRRGLKCREGEAAPDFLRRIVVQALSGKPVDDVLTDCGGQVFSFVVAPVVEDGYANLYGRDVTKRLRLEESQRQHAAALAEAGEAKDLFLNTLSHELRTPLSVMLSAVELLGSPGFTDETRSSTMELLERNIRLQRRLIDDLLDLSRIMRCKVTIEPAPLELGELAAAHVQGMQGWARDSKLTLELTHAAAPLPISGDAARLGQIISNLLTNAIKFTAPGGSIEVTLGAEKGSAVLRVKDTGVGIAADLLPHIFDAFRQGQTSLARAKGGLGIGLAVARPLAVMHGGTLEARSAGAGQGSEFTLRLPLAAAVAAPKRAPTRQPGARPGQRVLVIEDNPDLRDCLLLLLASYGKRAVSAPDGRSGLELAREQTLDVVLIDIGLPDIDGYEVARRLRADPATRDLRLIAVTGYAAVEHRARALEAGFDHHLAKPVEAEVLIKVLERGAPFAS